MNPSAPMASDEVEQIKTQIEDAFKSISQNDPDRAWRLYHLGTRCFFQFEQNGVPEFLDSAIRAHEEALNVVRDDDPEQLIHLTALAIAYNQRSERTWSLVDGDAAVDTTRKTLELLPSNHPDRAQCLDNFAIALSWRSGRTGSIEDLNEAISAREQALNLTPVEHDSRSARLNHLGCSLKSRFERLGSVSDLEVAIQHFKESTTMASNNTLDRARALNNLANSLEILSQSIKNLDAAVEAIEEAMTIVPKDHPERSQLIGTRATVFETRYEWSRSLADLNTAIESNKDALKLTALDHPQRVRYLRNLGSAFGSRFQETGSIEDVNEAILLLKEALELAPSDHPIRSNVLNSLGTTLDTRYERIGSLDDLSAAIHVKQTALDMMIQEDANRADSLGNLAHSLYKRFKRTGLINDFLTAVRMSAEALTSTPLDHPRLALRMNNYGLTLLAWFLYVGSIEDLSTTVEIHKGAVGLTPPDQVSDLAVRFHSLAIALHTRFLWTGSVDDLNESVTASREAVRLRPIDHKDRSNHLLLLGMSAQKRFADSGKPDDLTLAANSFDDSIHSALSSPNFRINSATRAAKLLFSQNRIVAASELLTGAVQLLTIASPRAVHRNDQQFALSRFSQLAADAAALAIRAGKDVPEAIRLLELGRGVMASSYLEPRSDISRLDKVKPELAIKFRQLCDEIDVNGALQSSGPSDSGISLQSLFAAGRRHEASKELDNTITAIQQLPGFERFLLGPSTEELKIYASSGPIVFVNVSWYGSDAFLVTRDDIKCVNLTNFNYSDLESNATKWLELLEQDSFAQGQSMAEILKWLWDVVAEPVLSALDFTETPQNPHSWPHIWWIPVGLMTLLPIHAAGYHTRGTTQTVLDRVISSYAPTAKALDHARKQVGRLSRISSDGRSERVMFVTMTETPNRPELSFTRDEISVIGNLLPTSIERINLLSPTTPEVLQALGLCSVAHFACHGEVDPDPSKSRLLLRDWESNSFSVGVIAQQNIQHARLAYISACQAATNHDLKLLNESIHLTSAFQLAGFPSVIGTLWQINDKRSIEISKFVYRALITEDGSFDFGNACAGLHFGIRSVREELYKEGFRNSDPLTWAPYVHVGV